MTSWQIIEILRELQVNVNTRMKAWRCRLEKMFTIVNANAKSVEKSGLIIVLTHRGFAH